MAGAKHPNWSRPTGTEWEISYQPSGICPRPFAQDRMVGSDVKGIGESARGEDCAGLSLSEGGTENPISGQSEGAAAKGGRLRR